MSTQTMDLAERTAAIEFWARQALGVPDDQIVSVSEFFCGKPTCANQHTAIMVMSQAGLVRKISLTKRIADIYEFDVLDACLEALRETPA